MAFVQEPPKETGWYWAKHKLFGKVVTHVQMVEGKPYVRVNEFSGWEPLGALRTTHYLEWDHSPIPEPEG